MTAAKPAKRKQHYRCEVNWISDQPRDAAGEMLPDKATHQVREFPALGLAYGFAARLYARGRVAAGEVTIEVSHLAYDLGRPGWYPWASYTVYADGRQERTS